MDGDIQWLVERKHAEERKKEAKKAVKNHAKS